ncbi:hypothetical protein ABPG72_021724 [Tetrahymena utriculariae]
MMRTILLIQFLYIFLNQFSVVGSIQCEFQTYQSILGQCKACPQNCEACFGVLQEISHDFSNDLKKQGYQVEQVFCVKCKNEFYQDYLNQKCVDQCKQGARLNKITKICELCKIKYCSNCNSDINQCDLCNQSYIKQGSQ